VKSGQNCSGQLKEPEKPAKDEIGGKEKSTLTLALILEGIDGTPR